MRLARWSASGAKPAAGVVVGDRVHAFPSGQETVEVLAGGAGALQRAAAEATARPGVPLSQVRLLPPVVAPSVRDFMTFEEHVEGVTRRFGHPVPDAWYAAPTFYFTNPHSLIGAHDPVPVPPGCELLDFELEVAAVVGRPGRDLTPEQARDHIAGYTILNDWSARDLQAREMAVQLGPAKGKDGAATLGPWLVTTDELEQHRDDDGFLSLQLRVDVNGVTIGTDDLARMAWTFEEMVSYASRGAWVQPGDVLGSGTCGSGCLAELWGRRGELDPRPLQVGDEVTMTVQGLGAVSNVVVPGTAALALPAARRRTAVAR